MTDIYHPELILMFLLELVNALAVLASRTQAPYPIVLVIGGLSISPAAQHPTNLNSWSDEKPVVRVAAVSDM
jgi:hypothetical protein